MRTSTGREGAAVAESEAELATRPEPSWPPTGAVARVGPAIAPKRGLVDGVVAAAVVPTEPVAERERVASEPASAVVPWVMAVLVLGALLGVASIAVAFVALRRQLEGRRPVASGPLLLLLDDLRRRAGIERPVRLTVAPRVQVPMAVGVLRPEIVVPIKAAQGLPPAHQESLLAHELAHVLRRDPAWRLAALLVERVFFFQPLNRLASGRVAQSAEYLCDDWAAHHTRQPLALASCLTEIATWVARTGPVPATMAGPRSILGRRVQRLLQPARASARPWWLSAALGLPLLAVVAVAPGVGAHAKGDAKRSEAPERVVVIDEQGRRHEVRPSEGGAIVVRSQNGELVVRTLDDGEAEREATGDGRSRREARKAARAEERERNEARRQARKELRKAFRTAKARGDAAPSRAEVEAILSRARMADRSRSEHVELHVVVPGEVEIHGHVPVDVDVEAIEAQVEAALEGLEDLEAIDDGVAEGVEEALEQLRALEGLEGLEQLGPTLEEIEEELEAEGLDVVRVRRRGAEEPELRVVLSPEQRRALQEAARLQGEADRTWGDAARIRSEADRARAQAERAREQAERAREQAAREHLRLRRHAEGDARREVDRLQREDEALRRALERAEQDGLPTVWMPAPEAPLAQGVPMPAPAPGTPVMRRHPLPAPAPLPMMTDEPPPAPPAPPRVRRARVPAPEAPRAPRAPVAPQPPAAPEIPAAPAAPQPDAGPVVWVSWPPPTSSVAGTTTQG